MVLIVVGLTYFPVLALGPILEHLQAVTLRNDLDPARPRDRRRAALARQRRASSTRATWRATRSCSSSSSAACSSTVLFVRDFGSRRQENVFAGLVAAWLWFTVLFANFAEAMAEGRGKAQADDAPQDALGDGRAPAALRTARLEDVAELRARTSATVRRRRPAR